MAYRMSLHIFNLGGNMKDLGLALKESRVSQQKSITDISQITKMNVNIITNIEDGNVDYFRNDLTYLKYYIKAYVNVLNLEIENLDEVIQSSLLSYTTAINIVEKDKFDKMNNDIIQKSKTYKKSTTKQRKRSIDWTLISLISIVSIIGVFLVYSVVTNILNAPDETPSPKPPIVDVPDDKDKEESEDEVIVIPPVVVEVIANTENSFTINNWDQDTKFITNFNVNTWVQVTINDQVVILPTLEVNNKTYLPTEQLLLTEFYVMNGEEIPFKEGDVISVRYGIMRGNELLINEDPVELVDTIKDATGGTNIIYTLGKQVEK